MKIIKIAFFLLSLFFIHISSMDINNQQWLNTKLLDTMHGMKSYPQLLAQYIVPLLEQGANINTQDSDGNTPLMLIIYPKNSAILHFLLANGANPNIRNKSGINALMAAARYNYNENLRTLLAANADPDIQDNSGNTALILSLFSGKPITEIETTIQLLLSSGADPNIPDNTGNTALHYAVEYGYQDIVTLLLQAGANSSIINQKKQSALSIANEKLISVKNKTEQQKYTEIINILQHPENLKKTGLEKSL